MSVLLPSLDPVLASGYTAFCPQLKPLIPQTFESLLYGSVPGNASCLTFSSFLYQRSPSSAPGSHVASLENKQLPFTHTLAAKGVLFPDSEIRAEAYWLRPSRKALLFLRIREAHSTGLCLLTSPFCFLLPGRQM